MNDSRRGPPRREAPIEQRQRPNGFSLVEALVALVLISIAALGIAGELSLTQGSSHMGTEQTRATSLAVQKMEELKPMLPNEIVAEPKKQINAKGEEGSGPYVRWVDVTDGGAGTGTKTVVVSVEYGAGRYGRRTVELYTIIYAGN